MIQGVKIKKIIVHEDIVDVDFRGEKQTGKKGDFREILRFNEGLLETIAQVSVSHITPWNIKAFHWHKNQDDVFYVLQGDIILVLYDIRENSSTRNNLQEIFMGDSFPPKAVLIPRGVLHGYQTFGMGAGLLYLTNNIYNAENPDEYKVPYDDPKIGFDWKKNIKNARKI